MMIFCLRVKDSGVRELENRSLAPFPAVGELQATNLRRSIKSCN